jgi:hypothetical protein
VKVLNINEGKNGAVIQRCRTLAQYSAFVTKVRDYGKEGVSRGEAVKKAVIYCRGHDILKEFLEENASEVLNMLITEWDWDDAKEVWQEEAREEGLQKGRQVGEQKKAYEIARKMKNAGRPIAEIAEWTGLAADVIKQIK